MKKYNFNAGPSILPRVVIENTAKQILDFNGSGLSLMEISHRAKDFQPVVDEAVALIKELLDIPEGYSVIFLGGGASLQFMQIPANFLIHKAGYVNSGTWAKKAQKEARHFGEVVEVASSAPDNYVYYPEIKDVPSDLDYLHITSNNTIFAIDCRYVVGHHESSRRREQVHGHLCRCSEEHGYGWCDLHHPEERHAGEGSP